MTAACFTFLFLCRAPDSPPARLLNPSRSLSFRGIISALSARRSRISIAGDRELPRCLPVRPLRSLFLLVFNVLQCPPVQTTIMVSSVYFLCPFMPTYQNIVCNTPYDPWRHQGMPGSLRITTSVFTFHYSCACTLPGRDILRGCPKNSRGACQRAIFPRIIIRPPPPRTGLTSSPPLELSCPLCIQLLRSMYLAPKYQRIHDPDRRSIRFR